MNLNQYKIGVRLAAGFGLLILFSLVMLASSLLQLQHVAEETRNMMASPLHKERLISDWYRTVHTGVRRATAIAHSTDTSLAALFAEDNAEGTRQSTAQQKELETLLATPEEKTLFDQLGRNRVAYVTARDAISAEKSAGRVEEANRIFQNDYLPASKLYLGSLQSLLDEQRATIDHSAAEIDASATRGYVVLSGIGIAIVFIGLLLGWRFTRSIVHPIGQSVLAAQRVAAGDLTHDVRVTGRDEAAQLLQALSDMTVRLRSIVGELRSGSETIAGASSQIAAGNADLSSRTEEQASALQQTAASIEELTSTVRQNADNARQANQLARATASQAQEGGQLVSEVVQTMGAIDASSKKIVDIIGVIDSIAFQTNILALNAAVEAARAGEQGRGFAVVASEVRNLAQRSAAAAKEIKALIDNSVGTVEEGNRLVERTGGAIKDIVQGVRQVSDLVGEISAASEEQTHGIEQVNTAVAQMEQTTQQNAALVEEASAATMALQDQAGQLAGVAGVFRVTRGAVPVALPGAQSRRHEDEDFQDPRGPRLLPA
ncbi:Methyl-accepting chemotaxis protein I (serine chemoreceptor protein) [plant metagenome]|uniref:Methyl-accepting chemotaxis protein I (Serine chemoreceptor protein) n=1 Tax=plant metagenome TaxID=1297885 RepID=A0A484R8A2_9ZZZZ